MIPMGITLYEETSKHRQGKSDAHHLFVRQHNLTLLAYIK